MTAKGLMGRTLTVFEAVNVGPRTCDLHVEHKRHCDVVEIQLTVVEERPVRQVWAEAWSSRPHPRGTGYRAVDQHGESWFRDWDGMHGDGPSHTWHNGDRKALIGAHRPEGQWTPPVSHDGWTVVPADSRDETGAKPKAIIVDVDGTVGIITDRSPYDWHLVGQDVPNTPVVTVVRTMVEAGFEPVFASGRSDVCADTTRAWLHQHVLHGLRGLDDFTLHMRPKDDGRPDAELKADIYADHIEGRYDVLGVFDDRDSVVAMWRNTLGLTVFQVNYGAF